MHPEFKAAFRSLQQHHAQMMALCAGLDEAVYNTPMAEGKWSAVQTIQHVHHSIQRSMQYLEKKVQYPETVPTEPLRGFIRSKLLNTLLNSRLRFKAPKTLPPVAEHLDLAAMAAEGESVLMQLSMFLESFPEALMKKNIFRHPVAGRITMKQTLNFMDAHLMHHERQISRWRKRLS